MFTIQQRERHLIELLKSNAIDPFIPYNILEIGCGGGGILLDLIRYGSFPSLLHGIDLLHDRLSFARQRLPSANLALADGQQLPYKPRFFDLLLQFTAFSSILDNEVKRNMAGEMLRVMKDGGTILWYDFWWNPINPQTAGIKPDEIRHLFPGCSYVFRKITLAPPIARKIAPISWPMALFLESLKIFNSHYLALIKKNSV